MGPSSLRHATTDVSFALEIAALDFLGSRDVAMASQSVTGRCAIVPLQPGRDARLTAERLEFCCCACGADWNRCDRLLCSASRQSPKSHSSAAVTRPVFIFNLVSYLLHKMLKVKRPKRSFVENFEGRFSVWCLNHIEIFLTCMDVVALCCLYYLVYFSDVCLREMFCIRDGVFLM